MFYLEVKRSRDNAIVLSQAQNIGVIGEALENLTNACEYDAGDLYHLKEDCLPLLLREDFSQLVGEWLFTIKSKNRLVLHPYREIDSRGIYYSYGKKNYYLKVSCPESGKILLRKFKDEHYKEEKKPAELLELGTRYAFCGKAEGDSDSAFRYDRLCHHGFMNRGFYDFVLVGYEFRYHKGRGWSEIRFEDNGSIEVITTSGTEPVDFSWKVEKGHLIITEHGPEKEIASRFRFSLPACDFQCISSEDAPPISLVFGLGSLEPLGWEIDPPK